MIKYVKPIKKKCTIAFGNIIKHASNSISILTFSSRRRKDSSASYANLPNGNSFGEREKSPSSHGKYERNI